MHLTYTYDQKGYAIYYKGKPILAVRIAQNANGCANNELLFKKQAEREIEKILNNNINPLVQHFMYQIDMEMELCVS